MTLNIYRIERITVSDGTGYVLLFGKTGFHMLSFPLFYVPLFRRAKFLTPYNIRGMKVEAEFRRIDLDQFVETQHTTIWYVAYQELEELFSPDVNWLYLLS